MNMRSERSANKKNGRVIVTYGRSLMALTAAHSLGKRGIEVIGCDDVDMTVLNFSKHVEDFFVHAPYQDDPEQYLEDLERNIRAFKPSDDRPYILMPMFRDAKFLAAHRDRFAGLIDIAAPDISAINQVNPKDQFAKTCQNLGLSIPETHQPETLEDLKALADTLKFPQMIKPVDDIGGRGIHKADTEEELFALYEESIEHYSTPPLVQKAIDGQDYCLSTLCDKGEIVAHMAYKNLYQFPRESGAGIMRETIDDSPFLASAKALLKALNWTGVAQIDYRWSGRSSDPAYMIEVNPRFWAGLFHSVESGVDYPWLLYQLKAFGKVEDDGHVEIGSKTKVPGLWTLSALQDVVESETHFDALGRAWSNLWHSKRGESFRDRFNDFGAALKNSVDGKDMIEKIKSMRALGKEARSEFAHGDDPFTGLGFLFIVSSLLRHGELPPELK